MFRPTQRLTRSRRRGVILLVVITLLTLFAIVGVAFVLYADSEATASRIFREGTVTNDGRPDENPDTLLAFSLSGAIFGADDTTGVYSALRGHDFGRNMYGWNTDTPGSNITPYNGIGRLHYTNPSLSADDFNFVNYTYYSGDNFLRDPERYGSRANFSAAKGGYSGWNAPYTYPDLNTMFLAAVKADGTLLVPSFHRSWNGFGSLDPMNANWYDTTNPNLKYMVLRPRPVDQLKTGETWVGGASGGVNPPRAFFPAPADSGGDVKNLIGAPSGNDSFWMDLGYPVQTSGDGRKFKPLFAFLIEDLDNRVNLNVHGNVRATGDTSTPRNIHASNQGWGPWEVNLRYVLTTQSGGAYEWPNLFTGNGSYRGRYGADGQPSSSGSNAAGGSLAHFYAQGDVDGCKEQSGYIQSNVVVPTGLTLPNCFPDFTGKGYGNGFGELMNHPMLFDFFKPAGDDLTFSVANMKKLLYNGFTGNEALSSDMGLLSPQNFSDTRIRNLVTTHSFDVDRPGMLPYIWDPTQQPFQYQTGGPAYPIGAAVPFPTSPPTSAVPGVTALPAGSDFGPDWRTTYINALGASLGRINLNRFLPPYPHMGSGTTPQTFTTTPMANSGRFDDGIAGPLNTQFQAANNARVQLADDIYRRLLKVTGVTPPANPAAPTDLELMPRRWLAQLAVNIVDFVDEDEISTPFNFYGATDGLPPGNVNDTTSVANPYPVGMTQPNMMNDSGLPKYWVYGTELPRVILNEVMSEYQGPATLPGTTTVNIWAELYNPLTPNAPADPPPVALQPPTSSVQPLDAQPVKLSTAAGNSLPAFATYQLVVAKTTDPATGGPLLVRPPVGSTFQNDNILGTPAEVRTKTVDGSMDFITAVPLVGGGTVNPPSIMPQQYFVVGPTGSDPESTLPTAIPAGTPFMQSANLQYPVTVDASGNWKYGTTGVDINSDKSPSPLGMTVLLRRLANPYLPFDQVANPYLTVDYVEQVPISDATNIGMVGSSASVTAYGKKQPYASDRTLEVAAETTPAGANTKHTLGTVNAPLDVNFEWLAHYDRQLLSQMELLNVSGFQPYQLTHQFITAAGKHQHLAPWFDQRSRIYRALELLATADRASGVSFGGRVPGRININTMWDPETFSALCSAMNGSNQFNDADVTAVFTKLQLQRTPSGTPSAADQPFIGLTAGYTAPGDNQYGNGQGIDSTFLRRYDLTVPSDPVLDPTRPRLFSYPVGDAGFATTHPYLRYQLMNKIANNVTTRSHVFAVWLTVGFFDVVDDSTQPVKLGAECGAAQNQIIRHRMFSIVDRSSLSLFTTDQNPQNLPVIGDAVTITNPPPPGSAVPFEMIVHVVTAGAHTPTLSGTTSPQPPTPGVPWAIQVGSTLVIDTGASQESVVVTAVDTTAMTFKANFIRSHAQYVPITIPGNPGPQPFFDPSNPAYSSVVPYFSVIQ